MATRVDDMYMKVPKFVSDSPALVTSVKKCDAEMPSSAFWRDCRGLDREILSQLVRTCTPPKRESLIRE